MSKKADNYYCQACNKNFEIVTAGNQEELTWLMTFYEKSGGYFGNYIEVYKKADGTTCINQKKAGVVTSKDCKLQLKVIANGYISDPNDKYCIQVSSYKTPNDPTGNLFFVHEFKMNKKLTKEALKNEAMKIVWKEREVFNLDNYRSQKITSDVCAYLAPILGAKSSGGCYVATAVYGSYDCPEVWTLRRFRDNTLAETWYGRAFIHIYYSISPTLVKWFGQTAWFKKMWKSPLDHMVRKLNQDGVEDTPYSDRNW